jgi:hypothetical protein
VAVAIRVALLVAGVCAAIVGAAPVNAEPAAYSGQDNIFYTLLTQPNDPRDAVVVTNFGLLRAQGLVACQRRDNGMSGLDAIYQLQAEGPYSFDMANSIASAAAVAYCPDQLGS